MASIATLLKKIDVDAELVVHSNLLLSDVWNWIRRCLWRFLQIKTFK